MRTELERSSPSREGINPEYIINFLNACEKAGSEIHGIMIARHGRVIFEAYNAPYAADIPHIMHSFTKTLTNTAAALACADGLLRLEDPLLKYFPEYKDTANGYLRACTIRNLITMRNGQKRSIGGNEWRPLKTSWKDAYFQVPFDKEPGKTYMYSSGNSYILSYIVQKLEGKTCRELVTERVGKKIGLTDFPWMLSPEGVCSGGNGVSLTTEDMLRIGLLYLNKGRWNGEQLIPEDWVDLAMGYRDPIEPVDGLQYNFHWDHWADIWAARGMFGQTCGQIPVLDMAFAITAADRNYTAMRLFQREIVDEVKKGMDVAGKMVGSGEADADGETGRRGGTAGSGGTAAATEATWARFEDILRQKGLRMSLEGKNVSVREHIIPPASDLAFIPEENTDGIKKVELHFTEDKTVVYVMEDARGRHEVAAGLDHWVSGTTTMTGACLHHQYEPEVSRVSAIAYWSGRDTLMMEWRFPEMAFFDHLRVTWEKDAVKVDRWVNMNSQDLERPTLILR